MNNLYFIQKELFTFLMNYRDLSRRRFPLNPIIMSGLIQNRTPDLLKTLQQDIKTHLPANKLEADLLVYFLNKLALIEWFIFPNTYLSEENIKLIKSELLDLFQTVKALFEGTITDEQKTHTTKDNFVLYKFNACDHENENEIKYKEIGTVLHVTLNYILQLSNQPAEKMNLVLDSIIASYQKTALAAAEPKQAVQSRGHSRLSLWSRSATNEDDPLRNSCVIS